MAGVSYIIRRRKKNNKTFSVVFVRNSAIRGVGFGSVVLLKLHFLSYITQKQQFSLKLEKYMSNIITS